MKKLYIIGLSLFAVLAFSVVSVAGASAAEWLHNGEKLAAAHATESSGLLVLTIDGPLGVKVAVDCEGILDGTVGPGAADETTAVLNAAGEEISKTALSGLALDCTVSSANFLCKTGELAEVWPDNLPWKSKLLSTTEDVLSEAGKKAGYTVFCASTGIEELCEGNPVAKLTNSTDVLAEFANQEPGESSCLGSGNKGLVEGSGLIFYPDGHTIAVS